MHVPINKKNKKCYTWLLQFVVNEVGYISIEGASRALPKFVILNHEEDFIFL